LADERPNIIKKNEHVSATNKEDLKKEKIMNILGISTLNIILIVIGAIAIIAAVILKKRQS